jgi:hypothetical protein
MGQELMKTFRFLDKNDIQPMLDLAYKFVYERGLAGTDFDKTTYNFTVKNWFVDAAIHPLGTFINDELIGFAMLVNDRVFYNNRHRVSVDLVYVLPEYRSAQYYQELLDCIFVMCSQMGVEVVRTSAINYVLDHDEQQGIMYRNGFKQTDAIWERDAG